MQAAVALASALALGGCGSATKVPKSQNSPQEKPLADSEVDSSGLITPKDEVSKGEAKPGWASTDADGRAEISRFADAYLAYVQEARTTRQSARALVAMAIKAGALPWTAEKPPKAGELVYWQDATNGSLAFLKVGSAPVDDGLAVLLASHDSALIRLTPNPIYERSGLALFDTSIMGTLHLESWLHTPLALSLYKAPASANGKAIDVVLGDDADEPVFTIPDLLPHLSRKVQRNTLIDSPERLDVVAGFTAKALRTTLKSHGLPEGALSGLEATLVPAGAATYVGVDKGLIAGANHASRAVPFAAIQALLEPATATTTKSTLVIFMGRDKQAYAGAGPEAHIANLLPKAVETLAKDTDALRLRRILAQTQVLMFDHTGGVRNHGVVLGTRRDDSSPSAFRRAIQLFRDRKVGTQLLQTSGWSEAREIASLDIDTIALGLPISGVGMPYELLSTYDLFQARQACLAWVSQ
jgi:aspartyl aminopeptidase